MSDDELAKKEEEAGTPLQPYDSLYSPLLNTPEVESDLSFERDE